MTQVKFLISEDMLSQNDQCVYGGFELKDGRVICGCCGHIYIPEEVYILERYHDWIDLSDEILGDDHSVRHAYWVDRDNGLTYSAIILDNGALLTEDSPEPWMVDDDFLESCTQYWEEEE